MKQNHCIGAWQLLGVKIWLDSAERSGWDQICNWYRGDWKLYSSKMTIFQKFPDISQDSLRLEVWFTKNFIILDYRYYDIIYKTNSLIKISQYVLENGLFNPQHTPSIIYYFFDISLTNFCNKKFSRFLWANIKKLTVNVNANTCINNWKFCLNLRSTQ